MLRRYLPFSCIILLSGCSLLPSNNPTPTLNAVNALQNNVNDQMQSMITQIQQQNDMITQLEKSLGSVTQQLKKQANQKPPAPQVIIKEKPVIVQAPAKSATVDPTQANGKAILGEEEWVWLEPISLHFRARIDTGATTSSLNAQDLQYFERDGKDWVRFNLDHNTDDQTPDIDTIESPIIRWVKIRQASAEELERRPVIEMKIKIGKLEEKAQFTLSDRSQMNYPVLLGRQFFKDIALVDVGKQYVQGKPDINNNNA